jgi:hypothetical protein
VKTTPQEVNMSHSSCREAGSIPPPLRRALDLVSAPRADLGWHRDVGTALAELRRDKYRKDWPVRRLVEYLKMSHPQIYLHMAFAKAYAAADLAGLPLSWAAITVLLPVPDPARRAALQAAAVAGGWSVDRLRDEARVGREEPAGRAIRSRKVSPDLAAVWRLARLAREWADLHRLWDEKVAEDGRATLNAALRGLSADGLATYQQAIKSIRRLGSVATMCAARLPRKPPP